MDDAGVRRHDAEVVERLLAPAEERVSLLVPRELERRVQVGGVALGVVVDLNGVVDDELDRLQRIDLARVAAEPHDAVAHRGEIHDRGHAGEVLQQHPRRCEGDFLLHLRWSRPSRPAPGCPRDRRSARSSRLSRFSSRIFSEYGSRATPANPAFSSAGRLKIWCVRPPAVSCARVSNEFSEAIPRS